MRKKLFLIALAVSLLAAVACSGGANNGGSPPLPAALVGNGPGAAGTPSSSAIAEFPIKAGDSGPTAITVALDGNPWFLSAGAVNRMTAAGAITQFTSPEFSRYNLATDIITGPDGALWFTANCAVADTVCFPESVELVRSSTSGALTIVSGAGSTQHGPFQSVLVNGNESIIWAAIGDAGTVGTNGSAYIALKTDGTLVVPFHDLPQPCVNAPGAPFNEFYTASDMARGPDGAIYIAASSPCGGFPVPEAVSVVLRIDQMGNITNTFPVPDVQGIVAGPDGNLWVTQSGATNAIGRLTTAGALTEYALPTAAAGAMYITLGNDGNLWFTEHDASKIGRVTTAGSITEYATPTPHSAPFDIASLPGECGPGHGDIWFTESTANKIGRMLF